MSCMRKRAPWYYVATFKKKPKLDFIHFGKQKRSSKVPLVSNIIQLLPRWIAASIRLPLPPQRDRTQLPTKKEIKREKAGTWLKPCSQQHPLAFALFSCGFKAYDKVNKASGDLRRAWCAISTPLNRMNNHDVLS